MSLPKCKRFELGTSIIEFIPANRIEAVFAPKVRSRSRQAIRPPTAQHFAWAAVGLLLFTVYGSLLPFHYVARPIDDARAAFQQITFYPTADLGPRGDWVISTVQYALLTFLGMAAFAVDRARWVGGLAAIVILAACITLAGAIEFLQLFFPPRTVSLNDILAESIGGILGVLVWLAAGQRITRWLRRLGTVFSLTDLARRLLPGYVGLLIVVHLMPFDFVVAPNELNVKWVEGKINVIPFWTTWTLEGLGKQLLTVASFLPVGVMSAFAFRRRTDHALDLPWQTFLLPPAIEIGQLLVYSRSFDATDLVTGSLGIAFGSRLAARIDSVLRATPYHHLTPENRFDWTWIRPTLLIGWGMLVFFLYWRPLNFTTNAAAFAGDPEELPMYGFRRMGLAPFVDYYWGSKYSALDNFVRKALAFVPLGVLMAWKEGVLFRPWATTRLLAVAATMALALQVGRYFLPGHSPSTTDILIFTIGAWLGYRITHLLRAVAWAESNSLTMVDALR